MLDSFPLGGGITSFEGLAAGLPIVTVPSQMVAWKFVKVQTKAPTSISARFLILFAAGHLSTH